MSEFKFACPICGQHITADAAGTGSQLECPTCYRKIVVPQAPASADPKFILSAAEANKPRPPQPSIPALGPMSNEPVRTTIPLAAVIILVSLGLAGAATFVFRAKIFGDKTPAKMAAANAAGAVGDSASEEPAASEQKPAAAPVITNDVAWNLDLAQAPFPDIAPAGKLRGEFVSCNRNTLTGGALGFRQAGRGLPDLSVTIYFFAKQPEELRGKTITITTADQPAPRVTIRWKEGKDTKSHSFTNGYALKIELGEIAGNRMAGKIYLSLPDEAQSRIAGIFSAEIKKPSPPKPRTSRPPSAN